MFRDEAQIYVKAGDGGNGVVSFLREKYMPRGGPDGGNGGHGGDVIIRAVNNCRTLLHLVRNKRHLAENGADGWGQKCSGKAGASLIIKVPPGTLIKDEAGNLLADLKNNDEIVIARGGKGGFGNAHFASPINQVPQQAELGEPGEAKDLFFELKLIADVGLVGFPNAGKSTLISRISAARPKIADYPFTTLEPHPGVVELSGERRFVVADLPGLIEGAHEGKGLGHKFLRHIERTKVLVYLLDIAPLDGSDPFKSLQILRKELELHSSVLAQKPFLVVANKMDLTDAAQNLASLRSKLDMPVYDISAVTGKGIKELLEVMAKMVYASDEAAVAGQEQEDAEDAE